MNNIFLVTEHLISLTICWKSNKNTVFQRTCHVYLLGTLLDLRNIYELIRNFNRHSFSDGRKEHLGHKQSDMGFGSLAGMKTLRSLEEEQRKGSSLRLRLPLGNEGSVALFDFQKCP